MPHVIEITSHQQQDSSDSTVQNNNGNDRGLASTGTVGAQEKLEGGIVPITKLLEMVARTLGVLVCGWVVLVLVQGGIVPTMETKDRVFVTVMFFLVCFHCWLYFCPQSTWSLTEATQPLLADNSSTANDIQPLALPIRFISRLFYWWKLVSAMTCVVLSIMRLASQDFGQKEVANKATRDFSLNIFYGLALAEALVLLFALTFVTIMAMQRTLTEALFEWAKPSQPAPEPEPAPLPPTHTPALWHGRQSLSEEVVVSHLQGCTDDYEAYEDDEFEAFLEQSLRARGYSDDSEDELPHLKTN